MAPVLISRNQKVYVKGIGVCIAQPVVEGGPAHILSVDEARNPMFKKGQVLGNHWYPDEISPDIKDGLVVYNSYTVTDLDFENGWGIQIITPYLSPGYHYLQIRHQEPDGSVSYRRPEKWERHTGTGVSRAIQDLASRKNAEQHLAVVPEAVGD